MEMMELHAEARSALGRGLRELRDQGYVPAVLYGHGVASTPLQVEERALDRLLARGGANNLISLSVPGAEEPHTVLIREIQRIPTGPQVLHLDFYKVLMTEKLQASVPIVIVGESPVVIAGLGAVVQNQDSIEVECLPGDLPSSVELDISTLERTDQNLMVGDIVLPPAVELLSDPETVVISLAAARPEEEEEEAEELAYGEVEAEEVEVLVKGKAARDFEESEEGEE